ncbi:30S ribosomal protein S3 [Candidatus Giovannonibacteria bacterium]|nr:30S ribosomal protein S3 [Candidatus Giovannonibacteria bacterium]
MSKTSHPYALRIGILRTWKSRWFNTGKYRHLLKEDIGLRELLAKKLRGMFVDSVDIERSPTSLNITIKTGRPGLLIGRGGEGIEKLKNEVVLWLNKTRTKEKKLEKLNPGAVKLNVEEIKTPEMYSNIVVEQIAQDLEKRLPFRRVMKQNLSKVMAVHEVEGVKIALSGRLDGAEMARYEWLREGKIPLQTLRADVDFARGRAHLPYGDLGIKVWIYKGEVFYKK